MIPVSNWYIGSSKYKKPKEPIVGYKRSSLTLENLGAGVGEIRLHSVQGPDGLKSVSFNSVSNCPHDAKHEGEPTKFCHCGFYAYVDLSKAYSHLGKHDSPGTVILKTVASGKMILYTDGVRAGRQRVSEVMVDRCYRADCGAYADRFCITNKQEGFLSGVCAKHAGQRYGKMYSFADVQDQINDSFTNGEPDVIVRSFHGKVKPWAGEFDAYKREDALGITIGGLALSAVGVAAVRIIERIAQSK